MKKTILKNNNSLLGVLIKRFRELKIIFSNSKNLITSESCIICNNNKFVPLLPLEENLELKTILCINCGLTKLYPTPSKEFIEKYYQGRYNIERAIPQLSNKPSQRGLEIKRFIGNFGKQIRGVFEIGCGAGGNLLAFQSSENKVELGGIEPSAIAIEYAKKNNINIIKGFSKDLKKGDLNNYNLILMSHVLEHFSNPLQELFNLRRIINLGTLIYIEVPDSEFPNYKRGLSGFWFQIPHIYYFSKYNIELMIQMVGFTILKFERYNNVMKFLIEIKNKDNMKVLDTNLKNGTKQLRVYRKTVLKTFFYSIIVRIREITIDIIQKFCRLIKKT